MERIMRDDETEPTCDSCAGPIQTGDYKVTDADGDELYICLPCWEAGAGPDDGEAEEL